MERSTRSMKRATRDTLYFEIGPDNKPTLYVVPGEIFDVETQINRGPWLNGHPDREAIERKIRGGNPASGCIYVEGAQPGQVLIVHIGEFDLDPIGFTRYWGNTGAMPGWLGPSGVGEQQKVVRVSNKNVIWSDSLTLPVAPMLGVVGVAMEYTRWTTVWAGTWGVNMDIQEITTGASVHLPISISV
jgi:amidase